MAVADVLDRADGWEWVGWLAFARLEPFGPLRDDLRAGVGAAAAANVWGGSAKPADFFPTLRPPGRGHDRSGFVGLCPALTLMG